MAFKKALPPQDVPDSPEKILLDLPRRKIPSVLLHQGEAIKSYVSNALTVPDVALQLPTGSGKTLVGLLIGEWRRRKYQERVVYLCPTRQLVNQVVEQADEQYGLTVNGFIGSARDYKPTAKAEYQSADRIAITNYSSLFNTNPAFDDPQIIIVDDSHAAENYIAALWTLRIERRKLEHSVLHDVVSSVLKKVISQTNYTRLTSDKEKGKESIADETWVEKIPTPSLSSIADELTSVIDAHISGTDLSYSWSMVKDHLLACHLYITSEDILLRPLIPPTWLHKPFADAKQRIFMSATLGAGGDLERLTGRKNILRLPVSEGWDRQGIGRRYFIFPSMSLTDDEAVTLRHKLMERAGRSLVLVPSDYARRKIVDDINKNLSFQVFGADDIETSKKNFVRQPKAVAAVAGRYDGIDFPGDDCRLLFIDGLPRATNAQERFIMSRMGANVLFNERIQTRVLQAIGRCTRSLQDYSAVVISGEDLPDYLNNRKRRSYLHPELQAELEFGIEQSKGTAIPELLDNLSIFLKNGKEWEEANEQIIAGRARAVQNAFPAVEQLQDVVGHEIEYQNRMWREDYEAALDAAESVLSNLKHTELQGYRALWHYLAGCAAWLGSKAGVNTLSAKARIHFAQAKEAAHAISWLVELSRFQAEARKPEEDHEEIFEQIERLESVLANLGVLHDQKYNRRVKEILEGLNSKKDFENAHRLLGEMLGFEAGKEETDASPDPWWISGNICLVFEDHAGAEDNAILDATKARQACTHPNWMKEKGLISESMEPLAVLVTPALKAKEGAIPHLHDVALWPLDEFRQWAKDALTTIRELRRTFSEPGDLTWRSEASEIFMQQGLDACSLYKKLKDNPASVRLEVSK